MKKIALLVALFLTSFYGFSQTTKPIDGFLGIKFGSSKAVVIAAIKARGGTLDKIKLTDALSFSNVKLGQRKADIFIVNFIDDKASVATFTFKPQDDYHAIEYYDDLVNDINKVYGKGKSTKEYISPAQESDTNQMGDLLTGGADYTTVWQAANQNIIGASIVKDDDDLDIQLSYVDNALSAQTAAREKAKEKADL